MSKKETRRLLQLRKVEHTSVASMPVIASASIEAQVMDTDTDSEQFSHSQMNERTRRLIRTIGTTTGNYIQLSYVFRALKRLSYTLETCDKSF